MIANGFIRDIDGEWHNLRNLVKFKTDFDSGINKYFVVGIFFNVYRGFFEFFHVCKYDTKEEAQKYLDEMMMQKEECKEYHVVRKTADVD